MNPLFVSIIMPIRDEEQSIARSLGSVLAQDYPSEWMEVIVADGLSDDATRAIIQSLESRHSNLRMIDNPGRTAPSALNAAIRQAKGEIIIRVDGHTEIASDYVSQCVADLLGTEADNVGGRMVAVGKEILGEAIALAISSPFGVGGARFHYSNEEEWVDTVYMGAWRKEIFERVGLFDEEQVRNQDDEFNYRIRKHGGRILLSPRIKSTYTVRNTLGSLGHQYFQYGYWKVRVLQKHPRQMRPRQFVPPAFVAALLGAGTLACFLPLGRALAGLLVGTYLIANCIASLCSLHRGRVRDFWWLPIVFATLHLSYGLGFLAGLLRFWKRWKA